jgi:hypothetical protein
MWLEPPNSLDVALDSRATLIARKATSTSYGLTTQMQRLCKGCAAALQDGIRA